MTLYKNLEIISKGLLNKLNVKKLVLIEWLVGLLKDG